MSPAECYTRVKRTFECMSTKRTSKGCNLHWKTATLSQKTYNTYIVLHHKSKGRSGTAL